MAEKSPRTHRDCIPSCRISGEGIIKGCYTRGGCEWILQKRNISVRPQSFHDFAVQNEENNNMIVDVESSLTPVPPSIASETESTTRAVPALPPLPTALTVQNYDDDDKVEPSSSSAPVSSPIAPFTEPGMLLATTSAEPTQISLQTTPPSNSGVETPMLLLPIPSGTAPVTLASLALTAFQTIFSSSSGAESESIEKVIFDAVIILIIIRYLLKLIFFI